VSSTSSVVLPTPVPSLQPARDIAVALMLLEQHAVTTMRFGVARSMLNSTFVPKIRGRGKHR
jgi:hypothetical protein